MAKSPVLYYTLWDCLFSFETDASAVGLRAALNQDHGTETHLLLAYTSSTLHNVKFIYSPQSVNFSPCCGPPTNFVHTSWDLFVVISSHSSQRAIMTKEDLVVQRQQFDKKLSTYDQNNMYIPEKRVSLPIFSHKPSIKYTTP